MYDILEGGAGAYDWANDKVQGMDTTDLVQGGAGGTTNVPLTALAYRTRNLQDRLKALELMLNADSDTVINNLKDILDAFSGETELVGLIGLLARKTCNVTTTAEKASWVGALELALRMYNLNITERASWIAGLGVDTKAGKTYNMTATDVNTWDAGGFFDTLRQNYDAGEFTEIVNAFGTIFQNPAGLATLNMGGGSSTFNVNATNWKLHLSIGAYQLVRRGVLTIGDVSASGSNLRTAFFPPLGTNQYTVVGSLVGGSANPDDDNDVMVTIGVRTASSFQIALSENASVTQNLWFDWSIFLW